MALDTRLSHAAANAANDALCALLNNGYLRLYDGSKPADANAAITTQNKLAELRFGATAFGASVNGSASANAITQDSDADATGTANWARLFQSDGTTVVLDMTVGVGANYNINMNSNSIQQHAIVQISSLSISINEAGS